MATSNQISSVSTISSGEKVTTTIYDRVSVDLLARTMLGAEVRARYAGLSSGSVVFDRKVRDTVIFPFTEI